MDDRPEGLSAAIEAMKPVVSLAWSDASNAQHRMWEARDEVDRLQVLLAGARMTLKMAEREYEQNGQLMNETWTYFRSHVERIPVTSGDAGAQRVNQEEPGDPSPSPQEEPDG